MEKSNAAVWVIAEQIDCRVLDVSLQLVGHARKLADQLETTVCAVLLGEDTEEAPKQLIAAGADTVFLAEDPLVATYQPELYSEIIVRLAEAHKPDAMLMGSTFMGRELAPIVAARLATGLTAHCTDITLDETGVLDQKIPAYGGLVSIICPEKRPQMATVATGVFGRPALDEERAGEVVAVAIPADLTPRTRTLEVVRKEKEGVDLAEASIVVAGGAGAGDAKGWETIAGLAETLNGALGSTRPAVDEGWADLSTMIGQSGKMVSPELYIGAGLSGEQQHMVGIVGAKAMVAINSDAKSPVFDQVDFGIVDDCLAFIPVFIQKFLEYKDNQVTCGSSL